MASSSVFSPVQIRTEAERRLRRVVQLLVLLSILVGVQIRTEAERRLRPDSRLCFGLRAVVVQIRTEAERRLRLPLGSTEIRCYRRPNSD